MKTLLIDSHYLCHRAIYTMGSLSYENQHTGILFGFLAQIKNLCLKFETNEVIFTWDSKSSLRKDIYPEYKNNRKKEELDDEEKQILNNGHKQFDILRDSLLPTIGFKNSFYAKGYEADDLLAIISMNYNRDFLMITADEDMFQILDFTDMYMPAKDLIYTYDDFIEEWRIEPVDWAEIKAVGGCRSDNISGVDKVGAKTAAKYLTGKLNPKTKAYQRIRSSKKLIERNRPLVTLPYKGLDVNDFRLKKDNFNYSNFEKICKRYGFKSFLGENKAAKEWKQIFKGNFT